MVHGIL
ncbi:unnamed protein product [Linum tenue]|nr:unnamed protein product [Linum tenue]